MSSRGIASDLARNPAIGAGLVLVVVGALVWWKWGDKLKSGAASVGAAVNPADDRNLAYRGVNAVGGALSGQGSDWSLGSWLYGVTHPFENVPIIIDRTPPDERTWFQNLYQRISGG